MGQIRLNFNGNFCHFFLQKRGTINMKHIKRDFRSKACVLTLGVGSVGQNSTFSEHGHVAYQNKENHKCSNMVATILPTDSLHPPPDLWLGSIGHTSNVAYQIKGNHSMLQHGSKYFARKLLPTLLTLWLGQVKLQFFQNMVMLHIKL